MYFKIKNRIDAELAKFIRGMEKVRRVSPLLFNEIKDFMLRKGKRLRPMLFIIGYRGFAKKSAANLYTSAISLELLHDFLLIHDDIIDKSDMRRGKPSMHKKFEGHISGHKNIKFNGQDLSLVAGDIVYAMAIRAFMSIRESMDRKERALDNFLETTIYTGAGEFVELLSGIKDIKSITGKDIYKIYDLKTAFYSFAGPLSMGAILGGADKREVAKLYKAGMCLGRAFQIKDDILGMFAEEEKIGKSPITDLQEGRKTILIWYAHHNAGKKDKRYIEKVLLKGRVRRSDLIKMRKILIASGALDYSEKEICRLWKEAEMLLARSKMKPKYKNFLRNYSKELLKI